MDDASQVADALPRFAANPARHDFSLSSSDPPFPRRQDRT